MKDIKPIIAENLASLRKSRGLTQAELAELFDYSDKAISRWERGDTMPDINVLYHLCDFYGVTLDYLVHKEDEHTEASSPCRQNLANRIVMTLLFVTIVWLAATVIFACTKTFWKYGYWQIFVWAVPVCCLTVLRAGRSWMPRLSNPIIWSVFVWSFLTGIYLQFLKYNFWIVFIVGIPAQIIIVLWYNLKYSR